MHWRLQARAIVLPLALNPEQATELAVHSGIEMGDEEVCGIPSPTPWTPQCGRGPCQPSPAPTIAQGSSATGSRGCHDVR